MILNMVHAIKVLNSSDTYNNNTKKILENLDITKEIPTPKLNEIKSILENISKTEGIPTPNLYIKDEKGLNVLAIGTKSNCTIILTKELRVKQLILETYFYILF